MLNASAPGDVFSLHPFRGGRIAITIPFYMEHVDILIPPNFEKSGVVKPIDEAFEAGDWVGTFNFWIIQRSPVPSIVYQQRSPKSTWAPGKLDVSAGGHYSAGETLLDGLREVQEELGRTYPADQVHSLGRRLNVSFDTKGRRRNSVVSLYYTFDDSALETYVLQEAEVHAICACSIDALLKLHANELDRFEVEGIKANGEKTQIEVTRDTFPENWDGYHQKMAQVAQRLIAGEKNVMY